jgi:MFS superfamily sulfate permease-like transporter
VSGVNTGFVAGDRAWAGWVRDGLGGMVAALFTLPGALAFGAIALSPLGEAGQAIGVAAGLVGAVVGGLVAACFSGTPGGIAAPSGQLAVLLAAGVATVAAGPIGDPLLVGCLAGVRSRCCVRRRGRR